MDATHTKRITKWLPIILSFLIVIIGSYLIGFKSGSNSVAPENLVTSLSNKDSGEPSSTKADFSTFWKAWNIINDKFVGTTTTDQQKIYGAIQGLTDSLGDPYTVFFPPVESKNFADQIAGNFEGVGMEVGIKDGKLAVVSPIKGSPAETAGIKSGDIIVKIDGKDSISMPTDQAVQLIRGKAGTAVTLTVSREGVKNPFDIKITRATIDLPTISTEKKGDVFVIALYSFTENSANLFRGALKEFIESGSHKLIVDLRGNPGGYLGAAVDMASWFLPSGKTIVKEEFGRGIADNIYRSKGYNIFTNKLRMIILVDGGSASAAEILSGALSENGVAKLVGVKTFGKGSVQELVDITPDTSLKVTVAKWLTPNGESISKLGITPDYVVPMTADDVKNKNDLQMNKALDLLSKEP